MANNSLSKFGQGATGNIATEAVTRMPPDGYTLLLVNSQNAINVALYERLNFDFVRDIAPVGRVESVPLVMEVHPSVPAKTVCVPETWSVLIQGRNRVT